MNKIRTLVAHNDEKVRNVIINSIKDLEYVDIVATANDGMDTYNKIINLKPEIVFSEYNFETMSGIDLMIKSKEVLNNDIPVFNMITDGLPENEIEKAYGIVGRKLNALIAQPYEEKVATIMQEYKEYMYDKKS